MYSLTKEQKVVNLRETLEQKKFKLEKLQTEIQNIEKKISKLESKN